MNGYWGARVLLFSKRSAAKRVGMVCVCVCVWGGVCLRVYVCWWGHFGVYHVQQITNLLFSQDLYKKKQNDD